MTAGAALSVALGSLAIASAQPAPHVGLFPLIDGLTRPVGIVAPGDGSGRLFIVEQIGRIRVWTGAQLLPTPFLDVGGPSGPAENCVANPAACGERGLLGLAFHPAYAANGFFFVFYTRESDGTIVVARYAVSGDPNVADPASAQTVLTIPHPNTNHNGGSLGFRGGLLYIGTGDGGGGGDPGENAQNTESLLGKILRVDIDADDFPADPTRNYAIPSGNPFAGPAAGADEVWAYGLRNPWRFSFDRGGGDLFIGDVGQSAREEIDLEPAASPGGVNYGWDCFEGTLPFVPGGGVDGPSPVCSPTPPPSVAPVLEVAHGAGDCSVTGGYVFRNLPSHAFAGDYLYGDFCSGRIWRGEGSGTSWSASELTAVPDRFGLTSFGEGETGRLYVAYSTGSVGWLQPHTFVDVLPTRWSWPWVEALHEAGITAGCAVAPRRYCPAAGVTRAEMAVFLLRSVHGAAFTPPPATGTVFADVPASHWAAAWIEQLFAEGITAGCTVSPLRYCPGVTVSREEMAIFLLRARHGTGYVPPAATGTVFADVAAGDWAAAWIEQLFVEGITAGCTASPRRYCPLAPVLREEMAVFLARSVALAQP